MRFRWKFGKRHGQWRDTLAEAKADAVKAELGSYDEHPPHRAYLMGGVAIEEEK